MPISPVILSWSSSRTPSAYRPAASKARYQKETSDIEYQLKFPADILDVEQGKGTQSWPPLPPQSTRIQ